jgi:hypothetical protein
VALVGEPRPVIRVARTVAIARAGDVRILSGSRKVGRRRVGAERNGQAGAGIFWALIHHVERRWDRHRLIAKARAAAATPTAATATAATETSTATTAAAETSTAATAAAETPTAATATNEAAATATAAAETSTAAAADCDRRWRHRDGFDQRLNDDWLNFNDRLDDAHKSLARHSRRTERRRPRRKWQQAQQRKPPE